ncbi:MAG: methylated-DNA--[protein]-cysteine S-methyltransferase [Hyphomicrobiales bacterium]|uniref:methylated-DNA--[protein]-cysteine S-methyltransferase n=1 Tax=Rhabdaerophilum calidifontis TaxID=2604328 RepID=UPI0012394733|nr:methylated-DNA--[protein]-cysteine S-methyltransferase [Rhabdaerophilum calidifontis]MCA1951603.1 methylated-DNA--[protein]-cysteine S-methyltransferase [Hyphomicrobiales bacterium]MCA1998805.1 methylated-DNA--[protein]-cysteine S-methyltransferase [Hyphomicrobiales bacterium]
MLDRASPAPTTRPDADYARVRDALRFITEQARFQPDSAAIAAALGIGPADLTALFRRWCGLTPKAFLQAVTLDHAKRLLDEGLPLLDCALEVGMSGPSRLHDLFVTHEAISPGEYKNGGAGLEIAYDFVPSPFGLALPMVNERGLCGLAFADEGGEGAAFEDMQQRWPNARYRRDPVHVAPIARRIFDSTTWRPDQPLRVFLIGTDFEIRVWETLLAIPFGRATTYSSIASRLERPKAARAVGAAVGRNPISFVVPCHRVLGKAGGLTGYHWGLTRKRAMLGWEAGRVAAG